MRRVILAVGLLLTCACGGGAEQAQVTADSIAAAADGVPGDGNGKKIVTALDLEWSFWCGARPIAAHLQGWDSFRVFTQGQSRRAVLDIMLYKIRYTDADSGETFVLVSTGPTRVELVDGQTFYVLSGRFEVGAGPSAGEFFAGHAVLDDRFQIVAVHGNDLGHTGTGSQSATEFVCSRLGL